MNISSIKIKIQKEKIYKINNNKNKEGNKKGIKARRQEERKFTV